MRSCVFPDPGPAKFLAEPLDNVRIRRRGGATLRHLSRTSERSGLWAPPTERDDLAVFEAGNAHRTLRGRIPERIRRPGSPGLLHWDLRFPGGDIEWLEWNEGPPGPSSLWG